LFIEWSGW